MALMKPPSKGAKGKGKVAAGFNDKHPRGPGGQFVSKGNSTKTNKSETGLKGTKGSTVRSKTVTKGSGPTPTRWTFGRQAVKGAKAVGRGAARVARGQTKPQRFYKRHQKTMSKIGKTVRRVEAGAAAYTHIAPSVKPRVRDVKSGIAMARTRRNNKQQQLKFPKSNGSKLRQVTGAVKRSERKRPDGGTDTSYTAKFN